MPIVWKFVLVLFTLSSSPVLFADSCQSLEGDKHLRDHYLIMVGEMHGTQEVPRYFGDLVCAALDDHESVAVGLELPIEMQSALDEFIASDRQDSVEILLDHPDWSPEFQDGRTSLAMLQLIQYLAELNRQSPGRMWVHLLDAPLEYREGTVTKGQSMASHIRAMADETDADGC